MVFFFSHTFVGFGGVSKTLRYLGGLVPGVHSTDFLVFVACGFPDDVGMDWYRRCLCCFLRFLSRSFSFSGLCFGFFLKKLKQEQVGRISRSASLSSNLCSHFLHIVMSPWSCRITECLWQIALLHPFHSNDRTWIEEIWHWVSQYNSAYRSQFLTAQKATRPDCSVSEICDWWLWTEAERVCPDSVSLRTALCFRR